MTEQLAIDECLGGFSGVRKTRRGWEFLCPYCGDSPNPNTRHGNIFKYQGKWFFHCYRCNTSRSLYGLVKDHCPQALRFLMDKNPWKLDNNFGEEISQETPKMRKIMSYDNFVSFTDELDDESYQYVVDRKVFFPEDFHIRQVSEIGNVYRTLTGKHPKGLKGKAIAIPVFVGDKNKGVFGIVFRTFESELRYIKVMKDYVPWGLDDINDDNDVLVCEGVFDAMSLVPNAVAAFGLNLMKAGEIVGKDRAILCFDNEPHKPNVVQQLERAVHEGWKVFIPPLTATKGADMNDLVRSYGSRAVKELVKENTFQGQMAKLKFLKWRAGV